MDVSLTNREPICFGEVPCCDKLATKEKPRPVLPDRTRVNVKPNRLFKPRIGDQNHLKLSGLTTLRFLTHKDHSRKHKNYPEQLRTVKDNPEPLRTI